MADQWAIDNCELTVSFVGAGAVRGRVDTALPTWRRGAIRAAFCLPAQKSVYVNVVL